MKRRKKYIWIMIFIFIMNGRGVARNHDRQVFTHPPVYAYGAESYAASESESEMAKETEVDEDYQAGTLRSLYIGNLATYEGADYYLNLGIKQSGSTENTPVLYYITKTEAGLPTESLEGYRLKTTVSDVSNARTVALRGQDSQGISLAGLEAGTYYVSVALGNPEAEDCQRLYKEIVIYKDAKTYLQALIRNTISYYQTEGFYGYADDEAEEESYLGLSADTSGGSGIDWETWAFSALGYNMNDELLTSEDGKTAVDHYSVFTDTYEEALHVKLAPKTLSRTIIATCSAGLDPRNVNGINLVKALIAQCYVNYDIKAGKANIDDNGCLKLGSSDIIGYNYLALGLEVAGATEREGYTTEIRTALLKKMIQRFGDTDYETLSDEIEEGDYETGSKTTMSDYYSMTMYSLPYLNDIPGYENMASELLDRYVSNMKVVVTNGNQGNINTNAVALNAMISAGIIPDDIMNSNEWKDGKNGKSLLTRIGEYQLDNGSFSYMADSGTNRMATYQAFGALVELETGISNYQTARNTYLKNYPQYDKNAQLLTRLENPIIKKITAIDYKTLKLSWDPVAGAESYVIYRSDNKSKNFKKIGSSEGLTFTDTSALAGTWYYKLKAYGMNQYQEGIESGYGSVLSGKTMVPTTSITSLAPGNGRITVKVKEISTASGYELYMRTNKTGSYKMVTRLLGSKKVTAILNNKKQGYTYELKGRTFITESGERVYSTFSKIKQIKLPVNMVNLIKLSPGKGKVTLQWSKNTSAAGYEIYMSLSKNGTYKKVTSVSSASKTNTEIKNLKKNHTYYFKVRAYVNVNKKKVYSSYSSVKKIKITNA